MAILMLHTFTYTLTDADGDTSVATVTVTVDENPDAVDDLFSMEEDGTLAGDVSDADEGDGPGTYALGTGPSNGTASMNPDGTFSYTPTGDFAGTDSFTYTLTDADGDTSVATVTVTVDENPDAVDDLFSMEEDGTLAGDVSDADEGDGPGTYALGTGPSNGTASMNPDGTFSYTPTGDFAGTDSFTYTLTDADGDTSVATITVSVDENPDAVDDAFGMEEDGTLTGDASDLDEGDGPGTYALGSGPSNGSAAVNPDGTFTYTPNGDFSGTDTFTYTLTDADGDTSVATVTVDVDANPDAIDDSFTVEEDGTLAGDVSDLDEGDGPGTYALGAGPSNGTAAMNPDGTFTYTPNADFNGTDTFTYTLTDADGDTSVATVTAVVDANPDAVDDAFAMEEDGTLAGDVSDLDEGDGPGTYTAGAGPANGTVSLNPDGTFTYTPTGDFAGTDTFTYTLVDADGDSSVATVTIDVDANPDAVDDTYVIVGPGTLAGDLSDVDEGDGPGTYTVGSTPGQGALSLASDGTFTYTPDPSFTSPDTFTYVLTDADGDTSVATVTVAVDALPVAVDDSFAMEEDGTLAGDLSDAMEGNGPGTYVAGAAPGNGSVAVNPDGTFSYTPNGDFTGTDTFTYTLNDADGDTSVATVTVTIDENPDAVDDVLTMEEDGTLAGDVSDLDEGDGPGTYALGTGPSNGSASLNPDGTFSYTPTGDFSGTDTFTYTLTDADGDTSVATVTVDVDANPDAVDDVFSVEEDGTLAGDVSDLDEGDGPGTYTAGPGPSNGTVSLNPDGTFTYTPTADFAGTDTFTYTLTDADGDTSVATATVNVDASPDAVDDVFSMEEDGTLAGDLSDADEGDGPGTYALGAGPSNGTATVNADGTFSYTPTGDFSGTDTFTYTLTDADGDSSVATVTVDVDANPDAVDDVFAMEEDGTLAGDVSDLDEGDGPGTYAVGSGPSNGSVSMNPDGTFSYTPTADFAGTDTFTYVLTDADGDTSVATATVSVDAQPDAVDDVFGVDEDGTLAADLSDADEGDGPGTYALGAGPGNGTAAVNSDGTFTYTPNADFSGTDTFTYTLTDADGDSSVATVTVNVDEAPDAVDDVFSMEEDGTLAGDVSDLDEGDGPGTYAVGSGPGNGSVSMNTDGTFSYTPTSDFAGTDAFTYVLTDADGDTSTATVTVTVDANPDAVDDLFTVEEDGTLAGDVSDLDEGDGPGTYALGTGPANGSVSFSTDGSFSFTPNADFTGTDTFTYTLTDADGDTSIATATVEVDANPDALDDVFSMDEDGTLAGDLSDVDEGDGPGTYALGTAPGNGTAAVNTDGTFSYTPNADWSGTDTFTYTLTDADGDTSVATATIVVDAAPDAVDDVASGEEDTPIVVDVSDLDVGDGPGTYTTGSGTASGGTVSLDPNTGVASYTPAPDFAGTDTFTYTLTDVDGDTSTATVTLVVDANPDAVDDTASGVQDTPISIDVSDVDEGDGPGTYTAGPSSVAGGTVSIDPSTGVVSYDPPGGFTGTDTFTYTLTDADGDTSVATVTVVVSPPAPPPPPPDPGGPPPPDPDPIDPGPVLVPVPDNLATADGSGHGLDGPERRIDPADPGIDPFVDPGSHPIMEALADTNRSTADRLWSATPVWYGGQLQFSLGGDSGDVLGIEAVVADDGQVNLLDGTDTIFLSLSYSGQGEVASFDVSVSGTRGLPDWLHLDRDTGDMFGKPPLDETTLRLTLKAQLEDGRGFEREVLLDVRTGSLSPIGDVAVTGTALPADGAGAAESLSSQLEFEANGFDRNASALSAALSAEGEEVEDD